MQQLMEGKDLNLKRERGERVVAEALRRIQERDELEQLSEKEKCQKYFEKIRHLIPENLLEFASPYSRAGKRYVRFDLPGCSMFYCEGWSSTRSADEFDRLKMHIDSSDDEIGYVDYSRLSFDEAIALSREAQVRRDKREQHSS